jgi:alcohol dehydrogenase class IV
VGIIAKRFGDRVLIITDRGIVEAGLLDKVKRPLEEQGIEVRVFDGCVLDCPIRIIEECAEIVRTGGYEVLVGLGGGSVLDTAKATGVLVGAEKGTRARIGMKVEKAGLPKILIPTTAGSGAEYTSVAVLLDESNGLKGPIYSDYLRPQAVIIDPSLTLSLPAKITADSGMDALSHCIESYTTWRANVISDMMATKGIELISDSLRIAYGQGDKNVEARYKMGIGSMLGINAFLAAGRGLGLAHAMSYPIQEVGHATHGEAVSLTLPHVMEYNLPVNLTKFSHIAELMGEEVQGLSLRDRAHLAVEAVKKLSIDVGMPQGLRDFGLKKEDITRYVDNAFDLHFSLVEANGRIASRQDVAKIFEAAF